MKNKDENWHNAEVKRLKKEKQEVLGESGDDYQGTATDVQTRKRITEEFKKKRRSIKRSEKQNLKKFIDNELNS